MRIRENTGTQREVGAALTRHLSPVRHRNAAGRDNWLELRSGVSKLGSPRFREWLALIGCLIVSWAAVAENSGKEKLINITTKRDGDVTHFLVENLQSADVTVTFEMALENLIGTVQSPYTAPYPAKMVTKAFAISPKDTDKGWNWSYTYYATFGSLTAAHDDTYVYSLPYGPGQSYRVSQGFNGEYSHVGANRFAIDWKMPAGTPVHAARDGMVVGVKADSNVGGPDSKYDCAANYILIKHRDDTLGQYVHLAQDGNRVNVGDCVRAGDFIGLSGNTGHTTGPHLHFSVFKAKDGKQRQSIPIKYKTANDEAIALQKGKTYQATQGRPGKLASENVRRADVLGVALPSTRNGSAP
jgi:murein DD-endopeptidase MepM/ murein hydrolase activator NlpD